MDRHPTQVGPQQRGRRAVGGGRGARRAARAAVRARQWGVCRDGAGGKNLDELEEFVLVLFESAIAEVVELALVRVALRNQGEHRAHVAAAGVWMMAREGKGPVGAEDCMRTCVRASVQCSANLGDARAV